MVYYCGERLIEANDVIANIYNERVEMKYIYLRKMFAREKNLCITNESPFKKFLESSRR